jgi:hypothetical protein
MRESGCVGTGLAGPEYAVNCHRAVKRHHVSAEDCHPCASARIHTVEGLGMRHAMIGSITAQQKRSAKP